MKVYTESDLRCYAAPISETEDEKCKRAIGMVRDAMKELGWTSDDDIHRTEHETSNWMLTMHYQVFGRAKRSMTLFVQGSYANRTNIPSESDVDVAVILENALGSFTLYEGIPIFPTEDQDANILRQFKDEVLSALQRKFKTGVARGNKSIKVKGNTYRVDADVVPCGRISGDVWQNSVRKQVAGVKIQPDTGRPVLNFPEQHIQNGLTKNRRTSTRFKKSVRVFKSIRCDMEADGIHSAKEIGSFLIESLLWNVDDGRFTCTDSICEYIKNVIAWLCVHREEIQTFMEINGIKLLGYDDPSRINLCKQFVCDLFLYCRFR